MAGFGAAMRSEAAVRQEIVLLVIGVPMALLVGAGLWQRVALIVSLLALLAIELLNTCAEKLCDHITPDQHPQTKVIKDMGSAAVFCGLCVVALV